MLYEKERGIYAFSATSLLTDAAYVYLLKVMSPEEVTYALLHTIAHALLLSYTLSHTHY